MYYVHSNEIEKVCAVLNWAAVKFLLCVFSVVKAVAQR